MKKKILIEGMTCNNCLRHVTEALSELTGVSDVNVKLDEKHALANIEDSVKDEVIKAALEEAGYDVVGIEVV
ncbi:MAG: heavy-metal-associated domain-containing protein [Tissierellales bacterium]